MNSVTRDMSRVVDGISMVAREFVRRSGAVERSEDVIQYLVKTTASVCGLTRGRVHSHQFANPNIVSNSKSKSAEESIVYFDAVSAANSNANGEQVMSMPMAERETAASGGAVVSSPPEQVLLPTSSDSHNLNDMSVSGTASKGTDDAAGQVMSDAQTTGTLSNSRRRKPRERKVPSTPFSRAIGFASLGAGLAWGSVQESAKRIIFGSPNSLEKQSPFLSERNAERLAVALCRMRGAALKLGQMLSIQDESLVPAPILAALEIVRQGADVMPKSQLNQVLSAELGPNWSSKLSSFNYQPIAAASIGQVHQAVTRNGMQVAMKIQYPGVADSIESDIENVKLLLDYTNLIPKGLYLDRAMKTDPNWSNYLFDEARRLINLIDFGAARHYPKSFVDDYLRMVVACANCDKDAVIEMSKRLGFLTGMESEIMLDAHVQAGFVVGVPFSKPGGYDFSSTSITHSISNLGATMLKHRLTPPPDEAYSLHRKLSGAFLACIKLGAVVPCREILFELYENYEFEHSNGLVSGGMF